MEAAVLWKTAVVEKALQPFGWYYRQEPFQQGEGRGKARPQAGEHAYPHGLYALGKRLAYSAGKVGYGGEERCVYVGSRLRQRDGPTRCSSGLHPQP